ncbi:MAG: prepilin peptidase [Bacteriovoracales bacterium]|nr:prepilin peptidase [Bacteriovoracales bacterium]
MSLYLYSYLLIQLVVVAWIDIRHRKIPNTWIILNIVTFIFLILALPNPYAPSLQTFAYPLSFLALGFVLFLLNIMGGGDSKFLASFFLLIPTNRHETFFVVLLYTTIAVTFGLFLINSIRSRKKLAILLLTKDWSGLGQIYGKKIPFAPIILFSWPPFGHIIGIWK